jgi:hypothetical protein
VVVDGAIAVGFQPEQLFRDFPELREYFTKHPAELSPYLARTFGVMGDLQPQLNGIRNTPFRTGARTEVITRNHTAQNLELGDMRAGFVEVRHPKTGVVLGLAGVKGNGFKTSIGSAAVEAQKTAWAALIKRHEEERRSVTPDKRDEMVRRHREEIDAVRAKDHSTGLVTVGEAFAELAKQRGIQAAMDAHNARYGTNFQTNEVYGIVVLPFHVLGPLDAEGKPELQRAAIVVRQSEYRGANLAAMRMGIPQTLVSDWYGFSQATASGAIIDFGGVLSTHPSLDRIFHIADEQARQEKNALFTRAYGRGFEIGRDVDRFFAEEANGMTQAQAEGRVREMFENELRYMLEPIEAERAQAVNDPHALKPKLDLFQVAAKALLRGDRRLEPAELKAAVDFIVQDKQAYLEARARQRDLSNPATGHEGYGDYIDTRRRTRVGLRKNDEADFDLRRKLLEAFLLRDHQSVDNFARAVRSSRPEARAFAWRLIPASERANPAVLQAMREAIRIKPGDSQHGIVAMLRLLETERISLRPEHAARLLEELLVARDPKHSEAPFVDTTIRTLAARIAPEKTAEAFMNAWKSGAPKDREKSGPFFETLTAVARAGLPEAQRQELARRLRVEEYVAGRPYPSHRVLNLLHALEPTNRALHEAHLRHVEQYGIHSPSFDFLVGAFPTLDRTAAADLRPRILAALEHAVDVAESNAGARNDVTVRARERLDRLRRKPVLAPVAACVGHLASLLDIGN